MYNERLSEQLAVVDCIDPDAYAASAVNGDIIDMLKFRRVLFIVLAGDLVATNTTDFKVQGSAASDMTGAADLTGKAITQLTAAGTDSNKQVLLEVTAEEVAAQGYRYIRGTLTLGTAGADAAVVAVASFARYSSGADNDLASVDEIVA